VVNEAGANGTELSDYVVEITGDCAADGSITLALDEDATCIITNTKKGMVDVIKTVNGVVAAGFEFEIRSGADLDNLGTTEASCTTDTDGFCDFSGAKFVPENYQFCEINMMPGWSTSLSAEPGAFVPNGNSPDVDNSVICVPFTLDPGETQSFTVDNTPPPMGDARTIGFWKNWTSCDGNGNQDPVLDETLTAAGGSIAIGALLVNDCPTAVSILDKRDIRNAKKNAGDAAYGLAAQLLAAELNFVAGAGSCTDVDIAANDAQLLLTDIGFDGTRNYLKGGRSGEDRDLANELAGILDAYNNNMFCL